MHVEHQKVRSCPVTGFEGSLSLSSTQATDSSALEYRQDPCPPRHNPEMASVLTLSISAEHQDLI